MVPVVMTWRQLIESIPESKLDEPALLEADLGELLPVVFNGDTLECPV
jgi:hypothetical protein